jgi:hypothetical protein
MKTALVKCALLQLWAEVVDVSGSVGLVRIESHSAECGSPALVLEHASGPSAVVGGPHGNVWLL